MYLPKIKILLNIILVFLLLSIFKNCKKIGNEKQNVKLEYSAKQKNDFNEIISTIIIPEQNQFPALLTFKKPEKLYIANNTNLLTDSIDFDYLATNNLFKELKFEKFENKTITNFKITIKFLRI